MEAQDLSCEGIARNHNTIDLYWQANSSCQCHALTITPALLSLGISEFELRLFSDHEPEAPELVNPENVVG